MNNLDNVCSQQRVQILYFIQQVEYNQEEMKELEDVKKGAKEFSKSLLNLINKLNK